MVSELRLESKRWPGKKGKASRIKKFNGTNFGYWRMQIEDYLYKKKLNLPLLGKKPDTMKNEE